MNSLVIYDSQYGNTKQIAEAVGKVFSEYGTVKVVAATMIAQIDLKGVDLLAVGGPTQAHGITPALRELLASVERGVLNKVPALAFDTRYQIPSILSGAAGGNIEKLLKSLGCVLLLPHESFFVEAKEGPLLPGELERAESWARSGLHRLVPSSAVAEPA